MGTTTGIDEALTQEIVRRILTVTKPDKIILFGSAATGTMTKDSDIDLLVVEPTPSRDVAERMKLRQSLYGIPYPFDVFSIATDFFDDSKEIIGGLAYPANKYGRVIYESR